MRKIIFAQVLTTNGTTVFSGLFDENENPVSVETECDDSGVTLTMVLSISLDTFYSNKNYATRKI